MCFGRDVERDTEIFDSHIRQVGSALNDMERREVTVYINTEMRSSSWGVRVDPPTSTDRHS